MSISQNQETQVSKFVRTQVAAFSRSHIALYAALILDVAQNVKATKMPRGYPEALGAAFPDMAAMLPKYCGIIAPALASRFRDEIRAFPATADGVKQLAALIDSQARANGYTLSLEDLKRFFKGEWSVKAQAEAKDAATVHKADHDADVHARTPLPATPAPTESLVAKVLGTDPIKSREWVLTAGQTSDGFVCQISEDIPAEALAAMAEAIQQMQTAQALAKAAQPALQPA